MRFYVPKINHTLGLDGWRACAARIGAEVSINFADKPYVLPLDDTAAGQVAGAEGWNYMSNAARWALASRLGQQTLPIDVLPTYALWSPDHVPAGHFFVKPDVTIGKLDTRMAYSTWATREEFLAAATPAFWQYQADPKRTQGAYVAQPLLEYPLTVYGAHVAVNADGQALVYRQHAERYLSPMRYDLTVQVPNVPEIEAAVQAAVTHTGVKGGLHHVQFVRYQDRYCLMDWNPRPTIQTTKQHAARVGFCERGLAHMLGLTYDGPHIDNWRYEHPEKVYP
jgi:hypothetical protein